MPKKICFDLEVVESYRSFMEMDVPESKSFGAILRKQRQRLDPQMTSLGDFARRPDRVGKTVTQDELAEAVGVTRVWYAKLERRVDVKASARLVSRLADVFMLDDAERNALFHAAIPVLRTPLRLDDQGVIHQLRSRHRHVPKRRSEAEDSQIFCLFHDTGKDLLDTLSAYCKAGLEADEDCLWVVGAPLAIEEAIFALKELFAVRATSRTCRCQSAALVSE